MVIIRNIENELIVTDTLIVGELFRHEPRNQRSGKRSPVDGRISIPPSSRIYIRPRSVHIHHLSIVGEYCLSIIFSLCPNRNRVRTCSRNRIRQFRPRIPGGYYGKYSILLRIRNSLAYRIIYRIPRSSEAQVEHRDMVGFRIGYGFQYIVCRTEPILIQYFERYQIRIGIASEDSRSIHPSSDDPRNFRSMPVVIDTSALVGYKVVRESRIIITRQIRVSRIDPRIEDSDFDPLFRTELFHETWNSYFLHSPELFLSFS